MLPTGPLGSLLTFASAPWYPLHAARSAATRVGKHGQSGTMRGSRPAAYTHAFVDVNKQNAQEALAYALTNISECELILEGDRICDPLYRSTLRALIAHVIKVEGPIFEDVLIRRIARAHDFGRATEKISTAVGRGAEGRFPRSTEGHRPIHWPESAIRTPYGLFAARRTRYGRDFGLRVLRESTRIRLLSAVERALTAGGRS